jgi:hypothetical protein
MDEATFRSEFARVIDEARAYELLVLKKMREMRLEEAATIEAKRRIEDVKSC